MGALNLDNTGSGAAVTLSSNGTALLLNGSAIGGGGGASAITISNKTAAYTVVSGDLGTIINCTSGTFTVSLTAAATLGAGFNVTIWNTGTGVITIAANGSEQIDGAGSSGTPVLYTGQGVMLVCSGTAWNTSFGRTNQVLSFKSSNTSGGARGYPLASGSFAIAIGQTNTNNSNVVASGVGAVAIGVNSSFSQGSQATGSGAMALGGSYASGTDSFAAAIANNTSSYGAKGGNSVAFGYLANASASSSVAISAGSGATASGTGAIAIGGRNFGLTASGAGSCAIGDNVTATAEYAFAFGHRSTSVIYGKMAYASGYFAAVGDGQTGTVVLRRATTDATASVLTSSGAAGATTNQVILPNNSAFAFSGIIVARRQASGGTESAAWKVEGLIRREGSAGTTVLVNSATTVIDNTPGWTLALSADTTNGGLAVTFTGAAATNIRAVATIQTSEVTYA